MGHDMVFISFTIPLEIHHTNTFNYQTITIVAHGNRTLFDAKQVN